MATNTSNMLSSISDGMNTLITSPQVDWKEGDVSVKAGQKITQFIALREHLLKYPDPDIALINFDFNVDEFGIDHTERV